MPKSVVRLTLTPRLRAALLAAAVCSALPTAAQMPSPKEMEEAMREMQRAMDKLTPEQRKLLEQTQRQMQQQAAPGADDAEIGVPARDAARLARVSRQPLAGAQLKAHVEALQPRLRRALAPEALRRAEFVEDVQRKAGGDLTARLRAAANGLAAWGAWPEATFLMGKVALASGSAQDLNNLAAFLTMQKASQAALPILITLDARYPNNSTILNNLGQAWFELGEVKEAERVLTLAVRRAPNHPQANVTKSRIEEARGDKAAAQASMRAAIRGGFSEEKAQRLARLGGKLQKDDLRWGLKLPADALGMGRFQPPALPQKWTELEARSKEWKAFRDEVGVALERIKRPQGELARKAPWMGDAGLRGPLSAKADRMLKFNAQAWDQQRRSVQAALVEAIQFEQQTRRAMQAALEKLHQEGEQKYRNVAGGYQYNYSCGEIRTLIDQYLDKVNPKLLRAQQGLLEFQRTYAKETLYFRQFMSTPASFEYAALTAKAEFLNTLKGLPASDHNYGLLHRYGNSCLKPDAGKRGGKLADFDEINCQHIVHLGVPGFGSIDVRCNRMETTLDPIVLPFKVSWTEDLNRDRVLSASAEIEIEGVTVGGHGEFDEQGLKSGGVEVGAGVGRDVSSGPFKAGVGVSGKVGIEFDRTGITDIRIEGGVGSKASTTVASTPAASASSSVSTGVNSTWSWSGGTSASASGGFSSKAF